MLTRTQTWRLHRSWSMDGVPGESRHPIDLRLLFLHTLFLLHRCQTDLRNFRPVRFAGIQPRVLVQVCRQLFLPVTDPKGTTGSFCSYNIREEDEDVIRLALNRSISVTVGVVWAGIVSRYWWPTEARRELSRALGE